MSNFWRKSPKFKPNKSAASGLQLPILNLRVLMEWLELGRLSERLLEQLLELQRLLTHWFRRQAHLLSDPIKVSGRLLKLTNGRSENESKSESNRKRKV